MLGVEVTTKKSIVSEGGTPADGADGKDDAADDDDDDDADGTAG